MADITSPSMNVLVTEEKDYFTAVTPEFPQYMGEGFSPEDAVDDLLDMLPDITIH